MSAIATTRVTHPGAFAPNPVLIKGDGHPVVYLHGPFGQEWLGFLDDLATQRKVYAPAHAGSVDNADLAQLDDLWDLILYYDDLFRALELNCFDLIGHSFGGMVAAEYAAAFPERVRKLVLIDAMGLWNPERPVEDHLLISPQRRTALRFHDAKSDVVAAFLATPEDPQAAQDAFIHQVLALSSTSHFIHPVPERGLHKRLRRITAPTLAVWGAEDQLTPPSYAEDFAAAIKDARVALVPNAGHTPHLEQRAEVSRLVNSFLS
jgi:pimeloyl-ACP methyl ester carboxylesterase